MASRCATLARQVRDALAHINDTAYLRSHVLTQMLKPPGDDARNGHAVTPALAGRDLHRLLVDAIARLRPAARSPNGTAPVGTSPARDSSEAGRVHRLLELRYVEGLSPPAVQDRLGIEKSQYYRDHTRALDALVEILETQGLPESAVESGGRGVAPASFASPASEPEPARAEAPAMPSWTGGARGLPLPLTSFVGRERELAAVRQRLAGTRLLTLVGPGGIGKTRLALAVAAASSECFPDGVHVVSLAGVGEPSSVLPEIALAVGAPENPGRPPVARLAAHLHGKRLLLVLDNFEPLLEAAPDVAALLGGCPGPKALVTSRAPLHVRGEHRFSVPPLALPEPADEADVTRMRQSEAVALFVARARAVEPEFALTEANASTVAEVCRRLDGLPLAIELAATRLNVLSPAALLARLDRRLPLLTGGPRDAPARHQTLRAALAWSYDILAAPAKALFEQLAVFAGGSTLEGAAAVYAAPAPDAGLLDGLAVLVDSSLLQRKSGADGESRFVLLETVQEYARERLEAGGGLEGARARHADFYRRLAEIAGPHLAEAEQTAWLDRLEAERLNLGLALAWYGQQEPETALCMATQLAPLWRLRGPFRVGWECLRQALDAAPLAAGEARARALQQAGELAFRLGEYEAARQAFEEAVARWQGAGDDHAAAYPLHLLGTLAHRREHYPQATDLYAQALALWQAHEDRWGIAISLHALGVVAEERGEGDRATSLYEEALAVWRDTKDTMGVAVSLDALGGLARAQGDTAAAAALHEEALAIKRRLGDRLAIAFSLDHLGATARAQGETSRAAALHEEALAIKRQLGEQRLVEFSLYNLCLTAYQAGDHQRAATLGQDALARCVALGKTADAARRLDGLADAVAAAGFAARAAVLLGAAATLRASAGVTPRDATAHQARLARVRAALSPVAFGAALALGQRMPPAQAVEYAVG